MRSFAFDLPMSRSQVHLTSAAEKALPSCHLTPRRSDNVSAVPPAFHDQPAARSGTIEFVLFCFTLWSKMTRLLNTPIIARSARTADSSWIDMPAGIETTGIHERR